MPDSAVVFPVSEPGIFDLDMDTYHSSCCPVPSVSSSGLRILENESPAHFWSRSYLNPRAKMKESTKALDFGKAVHAILFDDEEEMARLVQSPFKDFRTKDARAWRDEQIACGNLIITEDDSEKIHGIAEALARESGVVDMLVAGDPEKSLISESSADGIWWKSRPDRLPADGVLCDLKTCASAHPLAVDRAIIDRGYHIQMGLCSLVMERLGLPKVSDAWVVFVEKEAPFVVENVRLSDEHMAWGRSIAVAQTNKLAECLKSGDWHGYSQGPRTAFVPDWLEKLYQSRLEKGELT